MIVVGAAVLFMVSGGVLDVSDRRSFVSLSFSRECSFELASSELILLLQSLLSALFPTISSRMGHQYIHLALRDRIAGVLLS